MSEWKLLQDRMRALELEVGRVMRRQTGQMDYHRDNRALILKTYEAVEALRVAHGVLSTASETLQKAVETLMKRIDSGPEK